MKPWQIAAILAGLGILVMSKTVIGSENDSYPDQYDGLFIKFAKRHGIAPALVKAIAANESYVGKYQGHEPIGGTTGVMHIKLTTAQMFNKGLTKEELARPETEVEYAVRYIKWLWDRYGRYDTAQRVQFTVMAYNGGPGRMDEILKKGVSEVKDTAWYKNMNTYWTRFQGHIAKLETGKQNVS